MNTANAWMRYALRTLGPYESFAVTRDNKHVYAAARTVGCRIVTRRLKNTKGWLVTKMT